MSNPQLSQSQGEQQQQSMPQMPPPMLTQTGYNPITAGTIAAMKSAKQSIQADDDDRRRAMGMAMMQFAHGLGKTGYGSGLNGALNAVNQNLFPAYQTYQSGIDNSEAKNQNMLINQLSLEQQHRGEQYRRQRDKEEDALARERMHTDRTAQREMANQLRLEQKAEKLRSEGKMPEGATLFESMPSGVQRDSHKEMSDTLKEGLSAIKGKKILSNMEEIISSNPHLWNSYAQIIAAEESKNPTLANQLLAKLNKNDLDKIKILQKYTNSLGINEMKSVGGRPTDILKKTIFEAVASGKLSPEAFKEIKHSMEENFDTSISYATQAEEGLKYGWYKPTSLGQEKTSKKEEAPIHKANTQESLPANPLENMSDDELEKRRNELLSGAQ
jgi:hypothetical protein